MSKVLVLMGVSGSGKTTVGKLLSDRLGWELIEGDDFHPPENIRKMADGMPLNDQDRLPWLKLLNSLLLEKQALNNSVIISCSALKQEYREILRHGVQDLKFIYLQGDYQMILDRMQSRADHFMKSEMLRSQFDILEAPTPDEALTVPIDQPIGKIVEVIIHTTNSNMD